ncbi:MAG: universal stress protein [Kofleriaceae bacterium]|nr:universal stress protein [Myxococcales bacterium]MCB9559741.1 universal stress protein [Kofleriaceae bacterium]MCB9574001.1 universal stress protein [Kofleriaceae bacterium]
MDNKQVVVAYDFSETADLALERAVELACRAPHHILHFVTAIDPHRGLGLEPNEVVDYHYAERIQDLLTERLKNIFTARAPTTEVHFFVHARIGNAVDEILGLAEDVGADLVVIGSHGRTGLRRILLGSVSEAVVRNARCAVIIARAKEYKDVELEKVIDVPGDHARKARPHRYSYSENRVMSRPRDWPLN